MTWQRKSGIPSNGDLKPVVGQYAGPTTRAAELVPASEGEPCTRRLIFYHGVIDVGIDNAGRFVGCKVTGDLFSDEPLYASGFGPEQLAGRLEPGEIPLLLLLGKAKQVIGVHVVGTWRAPRLCDIEPSSVTPEERQALDAQRVGVPSGRWPDTAEEFEALMEAIERDLEAASIALPWRPIRAVQMAGKMLSKALIILPVGTLKPRDYTGESFVAHIYSWYEARYGKQRLALNNTPGRFVVELRGALWESTLPLVFGRVTFVSSRTIKSEIGGAEGRACLYNVLDGLDGLTEALRLRLTDSELKEVGARTVEAVAAYTSLSSFKESELAAAARSDLDQCVSSLIGNSPHPGLARWSALQAVEKTLKLALKEKGKVYKKDHDVVRLAVDVAAAGYSQLDSTLVEAVSCNAGVRYGDIVSTRANALLAFRAALRICASVAEQMKRHRERPPSP